jgi:dTDP-4-dehydrorhamnose reductase
MPRGKVLITGGTGLLALNWACAIRDSRDVVLGTHIRRARLAGTSAAPLPLEDPVKLRETLERLAPDVVVHTAGITSVDECERDPERARHVYADLTHNIGTAAARIGARFIHISTDHLFAGTHALYSEEEPPEPVNAYARAKLLAEEALAAACPAALVVRTNFFGWGHRYRRSFSDWVYYGLTEGRELTMFDDVYITPILADRLAACAHRLLDLGASGIYNVVGDERISKYGFGIALARTFGLPEELIRRGKIAASQFSAKRPPDMSLDNTKARERLGTALGTVAEHLSLLKQQEHAGRRTELAAAVTE